MLINKFLLITFILVTLSYFSYAQGGAMMETKNIESSPYEISFFVGMSSYTGDVVCYKDKDVNIFTSAGPAFGFNINSNFGSNFTAGLGYRYGQISGDDAEGDIASGRQARGFTFTNNLNEISLRVDYSPLGHKGYKLSPYVYAALGVLISNPDVNYNETRQSDSMLSRIQGDKNEISKTSVVFPLGVGLKYVINNKFTLRAEASVSSANDFLDGVSNSGNNQLNDYYGVTGISLGYNFGKSKIKPIKEI